MLNGKDRQPRVLSGLLGAMGLLLVMGLSACGPLGTEEEEPTATASAQIERASDIASPSSSPVPGGPTASPSASPESVGTAAVDERASDTTPASDEATPATDLGDLPGEGATPGASDETGATPAPATDATPQDEETPDTVVDSCSPDAIPPFEGDDPNFVTTVDLNFREGPGEDCDEISDPLGAGREVVVLSEPVTREGEDQEWVQIEVDGETGWVAAQFIEPVE